MKLVCIVLGILLQNLLPLNFFKQQAPLVATKPALTNMGMPKATVVLFLSPECPLCESYSITINQLNEAFKNKGIAFKIVIPGANFSKAQILSYRIQYHLQAIPFYVDPTLSLTHTLGATITPEAIVLDEAGKKIYQGRINNWAYELSRKRKVITQHDLKNVLDKLVLNQKLSFTQTHAVGCFIE